MIRQISVLLGGLLIVAAPAMASPFDGKTPPDPVVLRRALDAQARHHDGLMKHQDVVGTAVGWRSSGEAVVKIYTSRPGIPELPLNVDGTPVEIEVVGKIYALRNRCVKRRGSRAARPPECGPKKKLENPAETDPAAGQHPTNPYRYYPPVPIGVSAGHTDVTAGTIACRVVQGCHIFALSNNHIFADENLGFPGDHALHPGPIDGGIDPTDTIGVLYDFEPIIFSRFAQNRIDAAIVEISPSDVGPATPNDGYGTPRADTMPAFIGMNVMKYGRTTGLTDGWVDAINATVQIEYDTGVARFVGQIIVKPGTFSAAGDSGSLIVAKDAPNARRPVALLFAAGTGIVLANPIDEVLTRLGVTIDGD